MITCVCRITYANIFEPKENPSGALKYSCSLLIPKSDEAGVKAFRDAIDKAIALGVEKVWKGKQPRFRYEPMRDGDAELASGEKEGKEYENHYFVNCSSNDPPGVVDKLAKPLMDQGALYSGCYVRADINPFPYSNSGNNGIGWGLNNIMLVREGERLDGRQKAEDAFANFAETDDSFGAGDDDGALM